MIQKAQEYAKFIVAMLGVLITAGTSLIPETWQPWLTLIVALVTAFSVYAVPNKARELRTPDEIAADRDAGR